MFSSRTFDTKEGWHMSLVCAGVEPGIGPRLGTQEGGGVQWIGKGMVEI